MLRSLGASRLVTVNVHNPSVFEGSGLELCDLSAIPLLARHLIGEGLGGGFSVSLGKKAVDTEHARSAASILGGGCRCIETFRDPRTGEVSLGEIDAEVEGLRVAVFDDVITSGDTHLKAVRLLRERGAEEVHLACVHSLLPEEAVERVVREVDGFVCTDTIPNRFSRVGVAPLIAESLRKG
jgi:ribose-phosphate pyrophosphokinase